MAQGTRYTSYDSYDEQTAGAFDEDARSNDFTEYGSQPPMATRGYLLPEDPMPLFLDGQAPRLRGFGTGRDSNIGRAPVWPRILKAGIFAASAAAIAFAILSVENPLSLFANAKASLIGTDGKTGVAAKPASEAPVAVRSVSIERPAPAAQTTVGMPASPPAVMAGPTREEIAAALRAAHQDQPEVRLAAPVVVAPPARHLDPEELAMLLKRARGLIEIGDIAPARLLLERAADAQEASAALLLAQTYDPAVLGMQDSRSITPDPVKARGWYQKAARFGSSDAQQRLAQMQN